MIHSILLVPLTLHQLLMFWEWGKVEVMIADKNMFLADITMAKSVFYLPCVKPIILMNDYKEGFMESYNLTSQGFK